MDMPNGSGTTASHSFYFSLFNCAGVGLSGSGGWFSSPEAGLSVMVAVAARCSSR